MQYGKWAFAGIGAFAFSIASAQQSRKAGLEQRFKQLDRNGDGVLTLDEVKAYFGSRPSLRSPATPNPQPTKKP